MSSTVDALTHSHTQISVTFCHSYHTQKVYVRLKKTKSANKICYVCSSREVLIPFSSSIGRKSYHFFLLL